MPPASETKCRFLALDFSVEADMLGVMSAITLAFGLFYRGRLLIGR
jgi:hypothetical protein